VRYKNDATWPAPVWGKIPAKPYSGEETKQLIALLEPGLSAGFDYFL
jgi:diadenosine tetraphosphate (Ap4A) HIT family hydrolase